MRTLTQVVAGVRTFGYYNAGQDCTAACRMYVDQRIYERVVADLTSAVRSIKLGSQQEPGVEMGPLISAAQREPRGRDGRRGRGEQARRR